MGFTIDARTILELGRELISSDEIALYELIKNSVDAESKIVDIEIWSRFSLSDYQKSIELFDENRKKLGRVTNYIRPKLNDLEDEDCVAFLNDLIKMESDPIKYEKVLTNGYIDLNFIKIHDTGYGMTFNDLKNIFLRIGTKNRHRHNESNLKPGLNKLGDKGIGRLSAMHLGGILEVKTATAKDKKWNKLEIDWDKFDSDEDKDVDDIHIEPIRAEPKSAVNDHGTTIWIKNLENNWTKDRFKEIIDDRIAKFIDPFKPDLARKLLIFHFNGEPIEIEPLPDQLLKNAHATCKACFKFKDEEPIITGEINYQLKKKKREVKLSGVETLNVASTTLKRFGKKGAAYQSEQPFNIEVLKRIGQFDLEIYWYNRHIVQNIGDLVEGQKKSRALIADWAGGPMLYRNNFRVLPYGDHDDDWLSLDRTAFGRPGFKLNRQQVIGKVSLYTPHKYLREQTNREGLIQLSEMNALTQLVRCIIETEFKTFIDDVDSDEKVQLQKLKFDKDIISEYKTELHSEIESIDKLTDRIYPKEISNIKGTIGKIFKEITHLQNEISKIEAKSADDYDKFVYLAGIGLLTEFIFHELDRSVAYTIDIISENEITKNTINILVDQLQTLQTRINAFNELTTAKRQVKTTFDLKKLIQLVVSYHENEMIRHNINIKFDLPENSYTITAVRGMVIQILENLLVNAIYWLNRQTTYKKGKFSPEIQIRLDEEENALYIIDNGPGVLISRKDWIFKPFVTSKPVGLGKGLGLYISKDLAKYNGWLLKMDENSGFIKKGRLNGFVLKMA